MKLWPEGTESKVGKSRLRLLKIISIWCYVMYLNGFKKDTICVQPEYNHIQYRIWKYYTDRLDWISVANIFVYTLKFYRSVRHLNVFGWTALMSYLRFIRRSNDTLHPRMDSKMILMVLFPHIHTHAHTDKKGHSE